ncbi:hypothetical protein ACIBAI_04440 [Streptomyces sp. NPDC051041]|uniref:hypothetical protein n=1 Tax=Streptomyces sp. NPDC051041 TaxID=3365640 RepID=UPI0037BB9A7A
MVAVAVLVSFLAGCGPTGSGFPSGHRDTKMNMQTAADRADAILDGTFAAIKPPVQWTPTYTVPAECYVDRDRTVMTIISEQRRTAFLDVVERHWRSEGYELVDMSENGLATNFRTHDGFQLQVLIGTNGQAHFTVTTPCVEKTDVSAPSGPPIGFDYSQQEVPAPNVRSDFWSSTEPVPSSSSSGM